MNILVFGASGATGHELVKQALVKEHIVTAFVRNPVKLEIRHRRLKVIRGDAVNYQSVKEAVRGQDAVLSALGAASPFRYDQSVTDSIQNIIMAMQTNGLRRFIYMSFAGVKESRNKAGFIIKNITPIILATEIAGHEMRENKIWNSMLEWTIVRPVTLTNGKHTAQFRAGEEIKAKGITATISRADVADFMLRQLEDNNFLKREPLIMY